MGGRLFRHFWGAYAVFSCLWQILGGAIAPVAPPGFAPMGLVHPHIIQLLRPSEPPYWKTNKHWRKTNKHWRKVGHTQISCLAKLLHKS